MPGADEDAFGTDVFSTDVFGRSVGGTRFFEILDALAADCGFFPRVDELRLVDAFVARAAPLPASADTSSVQRTPLASRADGILIARFDKAASPFPRLSRQFTYRGLAEENEMSGSDPITERWPAVTNSVFIAAGWSPVPDSKRGGRIIPGSSG